MGAAEVTSLAVLRTGTSTSSPPVDSETPPPTIRCVVQNVEARRHCYITNALLQPMFLAKDGVLG